MLSGEFFTIRSMDMEAGSVKAVLELNAAHDIFSGHFPGRPVVPGVCMMQIVKEIMENITGTPLLLSKADLMKFLVVIDPRVNSMLLVEVLYKLMEDDSMSVSANMSAGGAVCFKFKGWFRKE